MAKPLARVLTLLDILQAGGTRTLRELAERLGVDERTVRRYVDHLLDLGVPVESVRGRYGGYRLAPGYRMPPLMLTDDEALAVILGLTGVQHAALAPHAPAAARAWARCGGCWSGLLAARLDALVAATFYTDGRSPVTPETGILLSVAGAAVERRPLAITYTDRNGRATDRVLHPYGVVAHHGRWYVTGLDSRSGEVRSFRLDRVTTASVQNGQFQVPAGFDPAAVVAEAVSGASYSHAVSVRVHGSEHAVRLRMPGPIAVIEPAGRGAWAGYGYCGVPSASTGSRRPSPASDFRLSSRSRTNCVTGCGRWPGDSRRGPATGDGGRARLGRRSMPNP